MVYRLWSIVYGLSSIVYRLEHGSFRNIRFLAHPLTDQLKN